MSSLPVELLDEILDFAVALGTITPDDATHICRRWRRFQKLLFKTVKLDPFDNNVLNLNEHGHLIPYIEELRVVPRSGSSHPSYACDLSSSFVDFLLNVQNPSSMVFCDSRVQWTEISSRSMYALLTVFQRDSFRSLEISVDKPFPLWMLLGGLGVASKLTVHHIGDIILPTESAALLSYQCSLTNLVLYGNTALKRTAELCLQQRDLAKVLLQNVVHLTLEYGEIDGIFGPPISPYVEILIVFLGSQLGVLDIRLRNSNIPPPPISQANIWHLRNLRHLRIRFAGCSSDSIDTLTSAMGYVGSVYSGLPSSSLIESFSLIIKDRRILHPAVDNCRVKYRDLHGSICGRLPGSQDWPHLALVHMFVDVNDDNFTAPIRYSKTTKYQRARDLHIVSHFQVNISGAESFRSLAPPQID